MLYIKNRKPLWLFMIVLIIVAGFFTCRYVNENRAREIAENYLAQKYTQKTQYQGIRFSWIAPSLYYVTFSLENNPDLFFQVMVQNDFTINEQTNESGVFSADNYYIANFEYVMRSIFKNEIEKTWSNTSSMIVRVPNNALYAFHIPEKLNDEMPLKEMEPLIDEYLFIIDTGSALSQDSKADEAAKMLKFIQYIKHTGYAPDSVVFWYTIQEDSLHKDEYINIGFDNGEEITSVDQIILKIEEEVFSSVSIDDDAYYKQYFTKSLSEKFSGEVLRLWGEDAQVLAELQKDSMNAYKIPNLRKDISIDDIEHKLHNGYSLEFVLPIVYDNENPDHQRQEAEKIFSLILAIQKSGYSPNLLTFTYLKPDGIQQHYVVFFANWGDVRWPEIESLHSVLERFNGVWYDK